MKERVLPEARERILPVKDDTFEDNVAIEVRARLRGQAAAAVLAETVAEIFFTFFIAVAVRDWRDLRGLVRVFVMVGKNGGSGPRWCFKYFVNGK